MSADLSIHLSELAFTSLVSQAAAVGKTPEELAAAAVESLYANPQGQVTDPNVARKRFEECFGSVDLGRPIGIANDAIDADLARAYSSSLGSP